MPPISAQIVDRATPSGENIVFFPGSAKGDVFPTVQATIVPAAPRQAAPPLQYESETDVNAILSVPKNAPNTAAAAPLNAGWPAM